MNVKNTEQKNIMSTLPIVKEDGSCQYWEHSGEVCLVSMRECWYCKYSDFRKHGAERKGESVCHRPENVIENYIAK